MIPTTVSPIVSVGRLKFYCQTFYPQIPNQVLSYTYQQNNKYMSWRVWSPSTLPPLFPGLDAIFSPWL